MCTYFGLMFTETTAHVEVAGVIPATPIQHPRPATTTNIRHAAAGSCNFPMVQKSCHNICFKEKTGNNVRKYMIGSQLSNGRLSFQPIPCRSRNCLCDERSLMKAKLWQCVGHCTYQKQELRVLLDR